MIDATVTASAPDMPMPAKKRLITNGTREVHKPQTTPKTPIVRVPTIMALRRPIRSAMVPNRKGPIKPARRLELKSGPNDDRLILHDLTIAGAANAATEMLYPSASVTRAHRSRTPSRNRPTGWRSISCVTSML